MSRVLIVDDEEELLETLGELMMLGDYQVVTATDGVKALQVLEETDDEIDVIVLDRNMPNMDGFQLLEILKATPVFQDIPVIFQTALGSPDDVVAGLEKGAFYYITKPYDVDVLFAILKSAIGDRKRIDSLRQEVRDRNDAMGLINSGTFRFSTLDEASELASLLANACPDPDSAAIGLQELFINSIEHGNLGISYDEKKDLLISDDWGGEVQRRLSLEKYKGKATEVQFNRTERETSFLIQDNGEGFKWQPYFEFSPERAMDPNGRGIAMANKVSFSSIEYLGKGNEVRATIKTADQNLT
jgi:CheY-like chemotaxis protein